MESLFNRYFWLVRWLGVSACVALLASAVVQYVAVAFLIDDGTIERVEKAAAKAPTLAGQDFDELDDAHLQAPVSGRQSVDVALFCPSCVVPEEPEPAIVDFVVGGESGELPMAPSKLPLTLVSTMVALDPDASMAVLADRSRRVAAPFAPGDEIQEDVMLVEVTPNRVVLLNAGRREFIDIHGKNCSTDYPCPEGLGDCRSDDECLGGLVCGERLGSLYNLASSASVCVPAQCSPNPGRLNSRTFCTTECRCASGKGDCDESAECLPGHMCAEDIGPRFGLPSIWDMCLADHCANGVLDADETTIDCGGKECGNCDAAR